MSSSNGSLLMTAPTRPPIRGPRIALARSGVPTVRMNRSTPLLSAIRQQTYPSTVSILSMVCPCGSNVGSSAPGRSNIWRRRSIRSTD